MFGGAVCVHFEARRAGRQPQPEYRRHDLFSLVAQPPPPPHNAMLESVFWHRFFFQGVPFLFQLCIRGKGGGLEASWWAGENKSRLQNKRSRFWQKCWWWRLQSFNHRTTSWWLLLCCFSACGATLAEISIFQCWNQFFWRRFFFQGFPFLLQLCIRGEGGEGLGGILVDWGE